MNHWIAQTMHEAIAAGARLYIQEAMHFPGQPRPHYQAGDKFDIQEVNGPVVPGQIIGVVSPTKFTIDVPNHGTFDVVPTPSGNPPSLRSRIPFDDRILV